jgi:ParB-like chromosome segregation protein Spo0J
VATKPTWDNRIVRRADVDPAQLLANPKNFRRHTKAQKDAFRGLVAQVGYIDPVLAQDGTDVVIDGHLRVEVALEDGIATVPVDYYAGTQAESDLILATKDPLAAMAYHDAQALDALMRELVVDDPAVVAMLADLSDVVPDFEPVGIDEQGRLDEKAKVTCPECGHEF